MDDQKTEDIGLGSRNYQNIEFRDPNHLNELNDLNLFG
jgi:hypothetical protein